MERIKLKESVDFKDIEKYGYKKGEDTIGIPYGEYGKEVKKLNNNAMANIDEEQIRLTISINKEREIYFGVGARYGFRTFIYFHQDNVKPYIQDLINVDLVEGVE